MDRELGNGSSKNFAVATTSPQLNKAASPNTMRWQLMVNPGSVKSCVGRYCGHLVRADLAHASSPPHLPLYWRNEVGRHQVVSAPTTSGLARPRMLDGNSSTRKLAIHSASNQTCRLPNQFEPTILSSDHDWATLVETTSPLAYDLQNSLAVAGQTLQAIARKVQSNNHLSLDDARQLMSTADNIGILSNWSDNLLLSLKALHGKCHLIRRRFRVRDWQITLSNLLEGMARQREVQIEWFGWTDGLPNLYLDPMIATKAFYNLTSVVINLLPKGSCVRLYVGQKSTVSRHLMFTIQSDNDVLSHETIQIINGSARPSTHGIENIAIITAKKLVALHGGSLTAHRDLNGGCDLRITLPVDTAESLVSSWLITNFQLGSLSADCYVHLYAVKLDGGDAEQANVRLQQASGSRSLVIRVSKARWLILELKSAGQHSSNSITASKVLSEFNNRDRLFAPAQDYGNVSSSGNASHQTAPVWLETLVYRTARINQNTLWNGASSNRRLPQLVEDIATKTQVLLSRQALIVDGLLSSSSTGQSEFAQKVMQDTSKSIERADRSDTKLVRIASTVPAPHTTRPIAQGSSEAPGTQVVSEIIRQWKIVQAKLSELNGKLSASHVGF